MSRGYRIAVPLQVARGTVTASDELCVDLDVLPILSDAEMRALVRDSLKEKGWKEQKDGTMTKVLGEGAVAVLDKDGKTVTVKLETTTEVQGSGQTQEQAQQALAARSKEAEKEAKAKATTTLAKAEPALRGELDDAVQKVYVEALKKKAAQMGQVESLQEERGADGSMEITIKVRA